MTAWQDQPPQSRRQLRLNERGDAHDDAAEGARPQESRVDVAESVEPTVLEKSVLEKSVLEKSELGQSTIEQPVIQPPRDAFARPAWETSAGNDTDAVAETPVTATHQPRSRAEAAIASGRRSQHSFPHAVPAEPHESQEFRTQEFRRPAVHDVESAEVETPGAEPLNAEPLNAEPLNAEPLNYFTQGRSQVPAYGGPSFGVNAVTPPPADPAEGGQPEEVSGGYRIRDFSPESRRNAFSSTAELPASSGASAGASAGGHLDYYTQQGSGKQSAGEQSPAEQPLAGHVAWQAPADRAALDSDTAGRGVADHTAVPSAAVEPGADRSAAARAFSVPEQSEADARAASHEAHEPHIEHTMTRRELRAMRESSAAGAAGPVPLVAPVQPTIESSTPPAMHPWSIGQTELPAPVPMIPVPMIPEQTTSEQTILEQTTPAEPPVGAADRFPFDLAAVQSETPAPLRDPVPLRSPMAPAPQSSRELSDAMAEFDALMARESGAVPIPETGAEDVPASVSSVDTRLVPGDAEARGAARDGSEQDSSGVEVFDSLLGSEQKIEPQPVRPLVAELPRNEPVEQIPAAETPESIGDVEHHYAAPAGHWSRQSAGDELQVDDGITLSRNIGATSGAVTANHLVISSVPTVNDLLKPFSPTGEIMITGTIDLPRSLGTTGAHPARYDHSDVDTLLEASDREDSNVDSAPVRAIRAVSTHTSSRGLIGTGKPPRSSRLPMILAVSTAAVAAVVVVLFVAGIVLRVF